MSAGHKRGAWLRFFFFSYTAFSFAFFFSLRPPTHVCVNTRNGTLYERATDPRQVASREGGRGTPPSRDCNRRHATTVCVRERVCLCEYTRADPRCESAGRPAWDASWSEASWAVGRDAVRQVDSARCGASPAFDCTHDQSVLAAAWRDGRGRERVVELAVGVSHAARPSLRRLLSRVGG